MNNYYHNFTSNEGVLVSTTWQDCNPSWLTGDHTLKAYYGNLFIVNEENRTYLKLGMIHNISRVV